ncbi:MAG: hypothetical protein ACP6IU_12065 [Candidatus Asgardarchaeia archaeon]
MQRKLISVIKDLGFDMPDEDVVDFFAVIGLLVSNKISLGKAAEILNMRKDVLLERLDKLGISWHILNNEEQVAELKVYQRIFGKEK